MTEEISIIIVGGGAAGFFAAISCAERNPRAQITILEKGKKVLHKVKISGGGRCNLTHACFDPRELVDHYPRGRKELLGPFSHFAPGDTIDWFEKRGVSTKIESDGRVFPTTDDSQTVVDCLITQAQRLGVTVLTRQNVIRITHENGIHATWDIVTDKHNRYKADLVMIATGSNPKIWDMLSNLGHTIIPPVPSLFTFNISDSRIKDLEGISLNESHIDIPAIGLQAEGPLLVTHWGLSGPAVLKLSAWGARELAAQSYQTEIQVNWRKAMTKDAIIEELSSIKEQYGRKYIGNLRPASIPQRLWSKLLDAVKISTDKRWADINKTHVLQLADQLGQSMFYVQGKSTFKDEFVTAGGVELQEVNFKRFESKVVQNLYFAGEVLNIDAITGGFNFQAAWTGGYLAGIAMANKSI